MITSVIELADALYKKAKYYYDICDSNSCNEITALARICSNANDIGLPLSIVKQLLKGTGYEKLI